ncbi:MAG: ATP-binding protein [Kiritimatiellae bacterium]|nr:ATP-binding protein [Kiritimatiellia bacterium]
MSMGKEKFFNTAGPCNPTRHYMLPATARLPGLMRLIAQEQYFAIHAPRQSGKTTLLQGLVRDINASGECVALYFTVESVQAYPDPHDGIFKIVERMRTDLLRHPIFGEIARDPSSAPDAPKDGFIGVKRFLSMLAEKAGKPLVVFFDEVDGLTEGTAVTFLRELRDGYITRETIPFPSSVAIVGMMDIRDMKAKVRPHSETLGSKSPFNVIAEDFTLRNFTEDEVRALYAQHTEATGQAFEPEALEKAWDFTGGQPWLVNALARECVQKIHNFDYSAPITGDDVVEAKESIIRRRDTHVDSLMDRLREERVRRVVEPLISGEDRRVSVEDEDYRYVIDLGLLREEKGALVPANRMYAEIIGRYLTRDEQTRMLQSVPDVPWATDEGLDMDGLMSAFQNFWRENSKADRHVFDYREATPHLVLMAFFQRVVNGGGRIVREMASGSGRLDLCVEFRGRRYAVEVKMRKRFNADSFRQLATYLDTLGLAEGWMPVFDDDDAKPWEERLYRRDETFNGKTIHIIGL